jgi:hypothetical protein
MQIQVLVEPVGENGYRAYGGPPFPFTAEGSTPYEAIQRLRQVIHDRLAAGAHVLSIDVPVTENPLIEQAGWLKDDPLFEEWQKAIADYRRQIDEGPEIR